MKKDIKRYIEAHKISEEIGKIVAGDDGRKNEVLGDFLCKEKNRAELIKRFSRAQEMERVRAKTKVRDKNSDVDSLLHKIDRCQLRKKSLNRRLRIAIASSAAVVIISLAAIYNFNNNNNNMPQQNQLAEVSVPTLIFDDGENVLLNDDSDKQKDEVVVKTKGYDLLVKDKKLVYTNNPNAKQINRYSTLVIPKQYSYTVVLGDGSEVRMNAGSRLRYPMSFEGNVREVELEGEAYFKVAKSGKPFVVKASGVDIKVYGTEFNVRVDMKSGNVEAILVSGSIGAKYLLSEEVMIKPNEMFRYNKELNQIVVRDVVAKDYICWCEDVFYYDEQNLRRVIDDISKWYGITLNYDGEIANTKISMNMSRSTNLDMALKFISTIINKKITKRGEVDYIIE